MVKIIIDIYFEERDIHKEKRGKNSLGENIFYHFLWSNLIFFFIIYLSYQSKPKN